MITDNNIYKKIGGEHVLIELVDRFYANMDSLPEAQGIRSMHPKRLDVPKKKLFMFLSGFFGGPNLYVEKYGPPKLRQKHLPFPIGEAEARQWLLCMERALKDTITDSEVREQMMVYFTQTAHHMRNKTEVDSASNLNVRFVQEGK